MKRRHIFEFTDLAWWPESFRRLLTDYLQALLGRFRPFGARASLIAEALQTSGSRRIIDLCSGAGGPWPGLAQAVGKEYSEEFDVVLTDRFPNPTLAESLAGARHVAYHATPVDARSVPAELEGVRTLFNGFHHFPPEAAREILQDAVERNQPIVVFELLQRTPLDLLAMLLAPINVLLMTPWIRPRKVSRFVFTYLVPVAPLVVLWDCMASIMRCYSAEEMLAMAGEVDDGGFEWSAGSYRHRGLPVTYLVGCPRPPAGDAALPGHHLNDADSTRQADDSRNSHGWHG